MQTVRLETEQEMKSWIVESWRVEGTVFCGVGEKRAVEGGILNLTESFGLCKSGHNTTTVPPLSAGIILTSLRRRRHRSEMLRCRRRLSTMTDLQTVGRCPQINRPLETGQEMASIEMIGGLS